MQGLNLTNEMFFLVFLAFIAAGFAIGFAVIYFIGYMVKLDDDDNECVEYATGLVIVICVTAVGLLFMAFANYCVSADLSPIVAFALCIGTVTGLAAMLRKQLPKNISCPTNPSPPNSGQAHS